MTYSKRFPKDKPGSPYAQWEEISLSEREEQEIEHKQRVHNKKLMAECLEDAKTLFKELSLKDFQTDITNTAIALFEKRASHTIYWKEEEAKKRFDAKNTISNDRLQNSHKQNS